MLGRIFSAVDNGRPRGKLDTILHVAIFIGYCLAAALLLLSVCFRLLKDVLP